MPFSPSYRLLPCLVFGALLTVAAEAAAVPAAPYSPAVLPGHGLASIIQLLDEPGIPEKGEQLR
jgi:hypothetical protein